jgi:hypothetical protein
LKKRSEQGVLRAFVVHGMTGHVPGYSEDLFARIGAGLGYTATPFEDKPVTGLDFAKSPNLRITHYSGAQADRGMIVYEYTWSPLTSDIKTDAFRSDNLMPRAKLNGLIKRKIMNDGLSEAVLYLTSFKDGLLQRAALLALGSFLKREYDGAYSSIPEVEVVFFAHSLGSVMLLDAIEAFDAGDPGPAENPGSGGSTGRTTANAQVMTLAQSIDPGGLHVRNTLRQTGMFVMFANQISLLEIAEFDSWSRSASPAGRIQRLGRKMGSMSARRSNVLDLLDFSDPNDLLSYSLEGVQAPNIVIHNIHPRNAWDFFGLFENPVAAHNAYKDQSRVFNLIMEGL